MAIDGAEFIGLPSTFRGPGTALREAS